MKRALDLIALAALVVLVGVILFASPAQQRAAPPLAADDAKGVTYIWPGALELEEQPAPVTLLTTCPLGPSNLPIRSPESAT